MDEVTRRRLRFALIEERQRRDPDVEADWAERRVHRQDRIQEAVGLLDTLEADLDLEAFRRGLDEWTQRPGYESVRGFAMMFVNQLVNRAADDPTPFARLLADALRAPRNHGHAEHKIRMLTEHVHAVKRGGHPAPGRVPLLVSLFWSMQDHARWPVLWPSAEEMLKALGWLTSAWEQPERYLRFRAVLLDLGGDPVDVERTLFWFRDNRWVGLDPALLERCSENAGLLRAAGEGSAAGDATGPVAERNALAIRGELSLLAHAAAADVEAALGVPVKTPDIQLRTSYSKAAPFRADGYAAWSLGGGMSAPSLRAWVTKDGLAVGAHPGWPREGAQEDAGRLVSGRLPAGSRFFRVHSHGSGARLEPVGADYPGGECFAGRWFEGATMLNREDLAGAVAVVAGELRDVVHAWSALPVKPVILGYDAEPQFEDDEHDEEPDLWPLVREFRETRPYPNEKDEWHHAQRKELAERLTAEALEAFDTDVLRVVANGRRYGSPGPQSHLNSTLTAATPQDLDRIAHAISELLWGSESFEERLDRVLDPEDLGFVGFGESVAMKLLAITHPERFVPTFPYTGEMGKASLMRLIGLSPPSAKSRSRGELQVMANDMIRDRLEPYFPSDPWAQGQFLYWLRARGERPPEDDVDVLGTLAKELLVEPAFVEELTSLLREKRQIVLYGPPGTGKTYLARRLAAALAPDPTRRMIVQFHPSTSYEDFFEGYRPVPSPDGRMTYALTQGPLALLAERAESAPGIDHVLVIDELNRANVPKVFGELLFLLEYRNESIRTLYRPEEAFELPPNLLLIGTMNSADRSVALVDAALRRRFHFVGFFPNEGPMEGLLERWLEANDGPAWVAGVVDMVNEELRTRLGGPHLQVGPSHFMVDGLDAARVERIWTYDIFPFVEDELYGDRAAIEEYRFERVMARFDPPPAPPEAVEE